MADRFGHARHIRELDIRASPYDLADLGYEAIRMETAQGKAEYVAAKRVLAERAAPLRQRLIEECDRLLRACADGSEHAPVTERGTPDFGQ